MPLSRERRKRIHRALLENIQQWIDQVIEAEAAAIPGNKWRLLHLQRNMEQAKAAIGRMIDEDNAANDAPAD